MALAEASAEEPEVRPPAGSLARDVGRVFFSPGALFHELPVRNRAGAALALLMALQVLYALAVLSTGVSDYEIDLGTQKAISRELRQNQGEETTQKLATALDLIEKNGTFNKLFARLVLLLGGPVRLGIGVSALAGALFCVVALRGNKPNYQTLLGITVFAAFVEVPRLLLQLALITQLQVSRVETSAAAFAGQTDIGLPAYLLLRRLDPFELWYYVLVAVGLVRSGQLRPRDAVVAVAGLAVVTAVVQVMADVPSFADLM